MKKHIHIHLPVKPALAALLLPKKTKDASLRDLENEYKDLEKKKVELNKLLDKAESKMNNDAEIKKLEDLISRAVVRSSELRRLMKAEQGKTSDDALGELQSKRKFLEEECDKADAHGDNRALDRIRKEIAALDKMIAALEKKSTKDDSANANGRKLVTTVTGSKSSCKVYLDKDWDEYQCELFVKGVWQKDATYHTDDKQDALDSANAMVKRADAYTKE